MSSKIILLCKLISTVINHRFHTQKKLLQIISLNFDPINLLLIRYSALITYWKEKCEYSGTADKLQEVLDSLRREVLYSIFNEFCIKKNPFRLIKMCLSETYSTVHMGQHLFVEFPIENGLEYGDALPPLILKLYFRIRHQEVPLNWTNQFTLYADVNYRLQTQISNRNIKAVEHPSNEDDVEQKQRY